MKHHIVIMKGSSVVENMMSKIATPKELRARLAKKYPGKRRIYFKIIDPQFGWFSIGGFEYYLWFIDTNLEKRQKKPTRIPSREIIRNEYLPYGCIAKDDIIEFPTFDNCRIIQHSVRPDSHIKLYKMEGIVNNRTTFINLQDLHDLIGHKNANNKLDVVKNVCGKKFHILNAYKCELVPIPMSYGLLTGKPLSWILHPINHIRKTFKYEIL